MGQIDLRLDRLHRGRMGAIQDDQRRIAGLIAERLLKHLRRQARSAHAKKHNLANAVGFHLVGKDAQIRQLFFHRLGQLEPAQTIRQLGQRVRRPKRVIFIPKPAAELLRLPILQTPVHAALELAQMELLAVQLPAPHGFALLVQGGHQLVERSGESDHAVLLQFLGNRVKIDSQRLQLTQRGRRLVEIFSNRFTDDLAVILKRFDGVRRHGIDGLRTDEIFHIENV